MRIKPFIYTLMIAMVSLNSCKNNTTNTDENSDAKESSYQPITTENMESAVIYEANIRQYSEQGTFAEFTKDIPQLKDLGVKIIWLMPIHPISEKNRKATGDVMVQDIEDEEERKKYLGSYYAVADYKKINPEFGSEEDFKTLIQTAHDNGMWVILDWVANHTGWDHPWTVDHPDFYTKNAEGEISEPLNDDGTVVGWSDVADLNYDNKELWKEMTSDMKYWITNFNIDGFRCDVAGFVPTEFWNEASAELRKEKDIFMLAESEDKPLFEQAFDMGYNWEGHHIMNEIAKGEANVSKWDNYMVKIDSTYQNDDFLMNFVTNHDENSWNGTIEERMGDSWEAFTALIYTIPGMPLVYSGQEYDMNHALKFFEKDQIPKTKGKTWPVLEKLGKLKNQNENLHGGKKAASYTRLSTTNDENILAFKRGDGLVFVANLSKENQSFAFEKNNDDLKGKDAITGEEISFEAKKVDLAPWQYYILLLK